MNIRVVAAAANGSFIATGNGSFYVLTIDDTRPIEIGNVLSGTFDGHGVCSTRFVVKPVAVPKTVIQNHPDHKSRREFLIATSWLDEHCHWWSRKPKIGAQRPSPLRTTLTGADEP